MRDFKFPDLDIESVYDVIPEFKTKGLKYNFNCKTQVLTILEDYIGIVKIKYDKGSLKLLITC